MTNQSTMADSSGWISTNLTAQGLYSTGSTITIADGGIASSGIIQSTPGDLIVENDIKIRGRSLVETLDAIQQRLNMLKPNPALEAEWTELQELGERYRRLEAELIEKQRAWEILKR